MCIRDRWWHDNDSRRNKSGLPDLLIVGRKAVWVELKAEKGRFRPAQQIWLAALAAAGHDVRVIRPSDLLGGKVQALMEEIR